MKQDNVIRNVPHGHREQVHQILKVKGVRVWARGRGPRGSSFARHQSLPHSLSERFSMYVTRTDGRTLRKTYWDYIGWDNKHHKPRLKFDITALGLQWGLAAD